jgi:predicted ester cyclase
MTREQIVEVLRRRHEAWIARDLTALLATYAENAVVVSPFGGVLEGHDDIERTYRLWLSAFADVEYLREDPVVDGNRAVEIARMRGTHTGDFFGLAPTGRRVEVQMAGILTLENGLIREERRIYDFTGVLIQVGVLKAKPVS